MCSWSLWFVHHPSSSRNLVEFLVETFAVPQLDLHVNGFSLMSLLLNTKLVGPWYCFDFIMQTSYLLMMHEMRFSVAGDVLCFRWESVDYCKVCMPSTISFCNKLCCHVCEGFVGLL